MTDDDLDSSTVVHSMEDLRSLAGFDTVDDVADWIWAESGIELDVAIEDLGSELNVVVGDRIGVGLRYPFTMGELWATVEETESEVIEILPEP